VDQQSSSFQPAPATEPPSAPLSEPAAAAAPQAMAAPAQPVIAAPPVARARGGRLLNAILGLAVVVAIAGVAFAAGRFTAPAPASAGNFPNGGPGQVFNGGNGNRGNGGNGGQGGPGGFLAGGGFTLEGTVESISGTTLTLKTASGQTIQVALDGSTTYHAQTDATASDVTTGSKVQVRLTGRGGFGGANGGPAASRAPTNLTATDVTVVP
jgi:hypothetical protein